MKIIKKFVEGVKIPSASQALYRDSVLPGFGLRVTASGCKSFILEKRINGKVKRITLGRYPAITVEQARIEAQKLSEKIAQGKDPVAEKKEQRARSVSLMQAFEDYLKARKSLKPATIFDYGRVMKEAFLDWQQKPLLNITKDMVAKRHTKLGEVSHARANLAMRVLRAIFNFAAGEYEDAKGHSLISDNPVKRLSHTRAWYRVERRQEAATLRWDQIDFKSKTLMIRNTKNRKQHTLPLSDYLYQLLEARQTSAITEYVFPGSGKDGYIIEPRKQIAKVIEASGVQFTVHDLRRTFITIAESLDIPAYALKHLLNHSMAQDVTAGYIVMNVERLRKPMQKITDYLLKSMQFQGDNNVVRIDAVQG